MAGRDRVRRGVRAQIGRSGAAQVAATDDSWGIFGMDHRSRRAGQDGHWERYARARRQSVRRAHGHQEPLCVAHPQRAVAQGYVLGGGQQQRYGRAHLKQQVLQTRRDPRYGATRTSPVKQPS